jgi:hypothetical protein
MGSHVFTDGPFAALPVLSALRWFGLRPGLERVSAGLTERSRCQSSIFLAVSFPTRVVPSAGKMWVSAARRV